MRDTVPTDLRTLNRIFENREISPDTIGFYDQPTFLRQEQIDPGFLDYYAAWVRCRPREAVYNERVRRLVPWIAETLASEILRDGQRSVCVDASQMLQKILEAEGIWCYGVRGALSIRAPTLDGSTHFWMYDPELVEGHVWIVAPPFEIVDISIKAQPYRRGESRMVPDFVAAETADNFSPDIAEYFSGEARSFGFGAGPVPHDGHLQVPSLRRALSFLPALRVSVGPTELRYSPGGVALSDARTLDDIRNRRWNERLAVELYNDLIRPRLASDS